MQQAALNLCAEHAVEKRKYPADSRTTVQDSANLLARFMFITGCAEALHCCKAHSNVNRKMENSTPCKMVTPENFISKLGTRDYVEKITYCTIFDVDRLSVGFSPNR